MYLFKCTNSIEKKDARILDTGYYTINTYTFNQSTFLALSIKYFAVHVSTDKL